MIEQARPEEYQVGEKGQRREGVRERREGGYGFSRARKRRQPRSCLPDLKHRETERHAGCEAISSLASLVPPLLSLQDARHGPFRTELRGWQTCEVTCMATTRPAPYRRHPR